MPPKGNSKAKKSTAGKKKAKTSPSEPTPVHYSDMLRSKKLFEFDIVVKGKHAFM